MDPASQAGGGEDPSKPSKRKPTEDDGKNKKLVSSSLGTSHLLNEVLRFELMIFLSLLYHRGANFVPVRQEISGIKSLYLNNLKIVATFRHLAVINFNSQVTLISVYFKFGQSH